MDKAHRAALFSLFCGINFGIAIVCLPMGLIGVVLVNVIFGIYNGSAALMNLKD